MRIMFGKHTVEEFNLITANAIWKDGESTQDNPSSYIVTIDFNDGESELFGEYKLDGTKETYDKAKINFEEILDRVLVAGYCRDTDFENFEMY